MKKLAAILCLTALATGAFAQGLVKFSNSATTLVTVDGTNTPPAASGFYFALLIATPGQSNPHLFSFAGVYGTNTAATAGGRFAGGANSGIATSPGTWAAGATMAYEIVGWTSDNGPVFNPAWMQPGTVVTSAGDFLGCSLGHFGVSGIGLAVGGGTDPVSGFAYPVPSLFGAAPLLSAGFNLVPVPEPTTMALAGLSAAALLIFRRRK